MYMLYKYQRKMNTTKAAAVTPHTTPITHSFALGFGAGTTPLVVVVAVV